VSTDPEEYVAFGFHSLVADVQRNELAEFEKACEEERLKALELRQQRGGDGLTMSELMRTDEDDPEKTQRRLDVENDRIQREVAEVIAAKKQQEDQLPPDRFPPPILTT